MGQQVFKLGRWLGAKWWRLPCDASRLEELIPLRWLLLLDEVFAKRDRLVNETLVCCRPVGVYRLTWRFLLQMLVWQLLRRRCLSHLV